MLYERRLLELWHGDYDVAAEILTPDFTAGEIPLLGNDLLRVADGRFAEYWVASWAGTP
jgi:hypothetical protein